MGKGEMGLFVSSVAVSVLSCFVSQSSRLGVKAERL